MWPFDDQLTTRLDHLGTTQNRSHSQALEPEQTRISAFHTEHQGILAKFERLQVKRADEGWDEVFRVDRLAVDQGGQWL